MHGYARSRILPERYISLDTRRTRAFRTMAAMPISSLVSCRLSCTPSTSVLPAISTELSIQLFASSGEVLVTRSNFNEHGCDFQSKIQLTRELSDEFIFQGMNDRDAFMPRANGAGSLSGRGYCLHPTVVWKSHGFSCNENPGPLSTLGRVSMGIVHFISDIAASIVDRNFERHSDASLRFPCVTYAIRGGTNILRTTTDCLGYFADSHVERALHSRLYMREGKFCEARALSSRGACSAAILVYFDRLFRERIAFRSNRRFRIETL